MPLDMLVTATFSGVLDRLLPAWESAKGTTVSRWDATAGQVRDRIIQAPLDKPAADVAFITASVRSTIEASGRLAPGTLVELARSHVGIAIRKGAPKPKLESLDDLKALILNSRTIALTDPNGGGNTGRYFMGVAERLGLAQELASRTRLYRHGGHVSEGVAAGEADFGVTVISEIMPIAGAAVAGPLPKAVENVSITYGALLAGTKQTTLGQDLLGMLRSPQAAAAITACGMEPA